MTTIPAQSAPGRFPAIDELRGLVIILMALDHVRDYFTSVRFPPTDLAHTTPALFATRWITHLCAPIFIFLAGVSARLFASRNPRATLQRFLFTRGLWLVVLEFTVVMFVWMFNFRYPLGLVMQVIWATGVSMCVLSGLVVLPPAYVGAFGALMIGLHNLLDPIAPARFGAWAPLWRILHVEGETPVGLVIYPLVPWIGVMAVGFALGSVYAWEPARRRRTLLWLGGISCAGFILLRAVNAYGDPVPWSTQRSPMFSLLSFLNVTKYPPSLAYVLITLGPGLIALVALEAGTGPIRAGLRTFGRVPLFAYVVHIALLHLLAGVIGMVLGYGATMLTNIFLFYPTNWGFGLPGVYLAWATVIAVLYPLCRWFAAVKRRRTDWWLAYL